MNRAPRAGLGAIAALFLASCAQREVLAREGTMNAARAESPWTSIQIADGSANAYRLTREADGRVRFVYDPVTAEQSSSGLYRGGPRREEQLAPDDARLVELWALLQKLQAEKAVHAPERTKGTGAIAWDGPAGKRDFIVQMGDALDGLLAVLGRFGRGG
jgi:hypothetical protein